MISRSTEPGFIQTGIAIQTGVMFMPQFAWDPEMLGDTYTIYTSTPLEWFPQKQMNQHLVGLQMTTIYKKGIYGMLLNQQITYLKV